MLKKSVLFTILLVALHFSVASAMMGGGMSGRHGKSKMGGSSHNLGFCIENAGELGLSDEQVTKLKAIHYELEKKLITLNAEKDMKGIELKELLEDYEPDLKAVEEILRGKYDAKIQIKLERLKMHSEVKKILSKEQVDGLKKLMMEKKEEMKGGMGGKKNMMMHKMMDSSPMGKGSKN